MLKIQLIVELMSITKMIVLLLTSKNGLQITMLTVSLSDKSQKRARETFPTDWLTD